MPRVRLDSAGANAAFSGQEAVTWTSGGSAVELVQGVIKTLTAQQWTDAPQAVKDACSILNEPATSPGDAGALTSSQAAALTSTQNTTPVGSDAGTTQTLANALQTSYNALQVDVAALRTKYNAAQVDIAANRTKLNALIDALAAAGITV